MFLLRRCPGCGRDHTGSCQDCIERLAAAARAHHATAASAAPRTIAPLRHSGHARSVVLGLKYANARHAAHELGRLMALAVDEPGRLDVVTWAPTSFARVAQRGYDPAELLARSVAGFLGLPCRRLLYRERSSGPQTGKGRFARLEGPRFRARPMWRQLSVLVVDDVTTTGATMREAAATLQRAGAGSVRCVAAAVAP